MRIFTAMAAAAGLAALSACGGQEEANVTENFEENLMVTDNFGTTDMNMDMNMDMNVGDDLDNTTGNAIDNNTVGNTTGNTTY